MKTTLKFTALALALLMLTGCTLNVYLFPGWHFLNTRSPQAMSLGTGNDTTSEGTASGGGHVQAEVDGLTP